MTVSSTVLSESIILTFLTFLEVVTEKIKLSPTNPLVSVFDEKFSNLTSLAPGIIDSIFDFILYKKLFLSKLINLNKAMIANRIIIIINIILEIVLPSFGIFFIPSALGYLLFISISASFT